MSRYLFDIESDGLLDTITRVWIIVCIDLDTKEIFEYLEGDIGWQSKFNDATLLVGHNIIGYDIPALSKVFGWKPSKTTNFHDTMLMSQSQNYKRFKNGRHRLEDWGEFLGYPKVVHEDWTQYSPEMRIRCVEDVKLNLKAYDYLILELKQLIAKTPSFRQSLRNEHATAIFTSRAEQRGWLFNKEAAIPLLKEMEVEMAATEAIIVPKLKMRTVAVDAKVTLKEYPWKECKWIKNGNYNASVANWFFIPAETGQDEDRLVEGPYSRIEFFKPDMSNMDDIKAYLYSLGWEPDEWNKTKTPEGGYKITSPKLSEESLLALGDEGKMINDYTTTKSRHSILKGWLSHLDKDSRLHGGCFTIATPTGRARHSLLVNTPGADKPWGKQIRSLFMASPGRKIIGADSSGNQFRALCHYLQNDDYTKLVLEGDVHQDNANILTDILREIEIYNEDQSVSRPTAKPFIYAFLFGAGGEKLSLIVLGKLNKTIGNALKSAFVKRVPGLSNLVKKINEIYHKTEHRGVAWIPAADGRKIYCDSLHKALNYLLQSFEAISCKAAVAYFMDKMDKEGIPYDPLIWYHDEFQVEVDECYANRTLEIAIEAYRESGKVFNMMILDGAGKIGDNWYETH